MNLELESVTIKQLQEIAEWRKKPMQQVLADLIRQSHARTWRGESIVAPPQEKRPKKEKSARLSLEERDRRRKEAFAAGIAFEEELLAHPEVHPQPVPIDYLGRAHTYTPDALTRNGIFLELKAGRSCIAKHDRNKMEVVLEDHPGMELRVVLQHHNETSVAWCEAHGVRYAIGSLPTEWLAEVPSWLEATRRVLLSVTGEGHLPVSRIEWDGWKNTDYWELGSDRASEHRPACSLKPSEYACSVYATDFKGQRREEYEQATSYGKRKMREALKLQRHRNQHRCRRWSFRKDGPALCLGSSRLFFEHHNEDWDAPVPTSLTYGLLAWIGGETTHPPDQVIPSSIKPSEEELVRLERNYAYLLPPSIWTGHEEQSFSVSKGWH